MAAINKKKKRRNEFLKPVRTFIINKCSGKETFEDHADKFFFVDPVLRKMKKGRNTKKTKSHVYETRKSASFNQALDSLLSDRRKMPRMFFTGHQLLDLLLTYPPLSFRYLSMAGFTFIPFKLGARRFVAYVLVLPVGGSLKVYVDRFEDSRVWLAVDRDCMVVPHVPQLAKL